MGSMEEEVERLESDKLRPSPLEIQTLSPELRQYRTLSAICPPHDGLLTHCRWRSVTLPRSCLWAQVQSRLSLCSQSILAT